MEMRGAKGRGKSEHGEHPDTIERRGKVRNLPWSIGCMPWCRMFFWEGQTLQASAQELQGLQNKDPLKEFMNKHRRLISLGVPALVVHFIWWAIFIKHDLFHLFTDRYALVITMIFGSIMAGLTSIGASAIAFPVLTLILNVTPDVARDFGIFAQALGLSCATCTIVLLGVNLEWNAIIFMGIGGVIGLIFGLEVVEKHMKPDLKKMIFASFWFSFAFALFLLNRNRGRRTFSKIYKMNWWKALILLVGGIIGGIFGSFVGSGIDICSLSILTLFFRLSEKSATPTALVIISSNSVMGLIWRQGLQDDVSAESWYFFAVCAAVIVVGAPVGSLIGSHLHRQVIAWCICIMVTLTLITSFALVKQTGLLIGVSLGVIALGAGVFGLFTYLGQKLLEQLEKDAQEQLTQEAKETSTKGFRMEGEGKRDREMDQVFISHL